MKHSSRIDYLKRIDRVVAHVSSTLEKQEPAPSIAELARKANLSEFHFMRVYRALAGESLGATIQRLRLSRAVYLLTRTDASIVDIAGNVGFETSQALAKALRRELGMSPSEVRERNVSTRKTCSSRHFASRSTSPPSASRSSSSSRFASPRATQ